MTKPFPLRVTWADHAHVLVTAESSSDAYERVSSYFAARRPMVGMLRHVPVPNQDGSIGFVLNNFRTIF
ncbi:hypothetical protein LCGC14_1353020 [marine sediment metagenome]|uniref:Uncharacterized protein n=1 Tax=marine sediment metagenome TaxID=412755 RepID=A0A0F9KAX2_9ZZZZ